MKKRFGKIMNKFNKKWGLLIEVLAIVFCLLILKKIINFFDLAGFHTTLTMSKRNEATHREWRKKLQTKDPFKVSSIINLQEIGIRYLSGC